MVRFTFRYPRSDRICDSCSALLLTVDTNVLGHRQINEKFKGTRGEIDNGIRLEPETRYPGYHDARLNWEHLDWLKSISGGKPIYLKGVCAAEVSCIDLVYAEALELNQS